MRVGITLACRRCKQRSYNMTKERKNHPERMETRNDHSSARDTQCTREQLVTLDCEVGLCKKKEKSAEQDRQAKEPKKSCGSRG